jgi:hypothetical protein
MLSDNQAEQQRRGEALRLALVSHDPAHWIQKLFPELVGPPKTSTNGQKGVPVSKQEDLADTKGAWQFTEEVTPEEAERIMADMLANPSGTLSAMDLDDEEWS